MVDRGQGRTLCPGEGVITQIIQVRNDLGFGIRVVCGGDGHRVVRERGNTLFIASE